MNRLLSAAVMVLVASAIGVLPASGQGSIRSSEDLDRFLTYYYTDPHPERVQSAIEYLGASGILNNESAQPPVIAFFGEVFARNRPRLSDWTAVIQRQPEQTRRLLDSAVALSLDPGGLIAKEPPSPNRNDACWGAFFASGDAVYLDLLIKQLAHTDERGDLNLFLTAASAKWSLASNARNHPRVEAAVKAARQTAQGRLAADLADVLEKSPEAIQQEFVEALRQRWKKAP